MLAAPRHARSHAGVGDGGVVERAQLAEGPASPQEGLVDAQEKVLADVEAES